MHANGPQPDPTLSVAHPGVTCSLADSLAGTRESGNSTFAAAPPAASQRYELGAEIARGGMGAVYRATDTLFGREVAVKVLLDKYASTSGIARRFAEEARISGQLQHPNIPAVHDLGILPDGRPFLAMKLIQGETLDHLLKSRIVPSTDRGRFVAAFEQVCQAVAYAHAHGVIHRDLKPGNVMVGAFGEVQVMDWGLAKVLGTRDADVTESDEAAGPTMPQSCRESDGEFTQAGSVLGTPAYMPPEQALGAINEIDARSDVFGLGAILAVILTGKPPFVQESVETTRQHAAQGKVQECFLRLDSCGAEAELAGLCKRCLAPMMNDRPADAGEVARAVAEYRAVVETRLRQAEADRARREVQLVEQRRRRRWQVAVVAAAILLVACGAAFAWWSREAEQRARVAAASHEAENALNQAQIAREETARLQAEEEVRVRQLLNRAALLSLLDTARDDLPDGDASRIASTLAQAHQRLAEGGAEDLRPRYDAYANDLEMLRALDRIDLGHWLRIDGEEVTPQTHIRRYAAAFEHYGIRTGVTPPAEAADRIRKSAIRDRLLSALDGWLVTDRQDGKLRDLLAALDPDPFRTRVRETDYARAVAERVAGGVKLPPELPHGFAVAQGLDLTLDAKVREQLLMRAYPDYPNNLRLLVSLSAAPNPQRDPQLAERCAGWARAALAVDTRNPGAWNNLGIAQLMLDQNQDSVESLRKGLEVAAEESTLHHNLAVAYRTLRKFQDAVAADQEALRLNPSDAVAWRSLAQSYIHKPKPDQKSGEEAIQQALKLDPNNSRAQVLLGQLRLLQKRNVEAQAAFKRGLELNPGSVECRIQLAQVFEDLQQWDEVLAHCDEALALNANSEAALFHKGRALYAKGEHAASIPPLRQAVQLNPSRRKGHEYLALALTEQGDLEGATDVLERAVTIWPRHFEAHLLLGNVYSRRNMHAQAVAAFKAATGFPDRSSRATAYMLLAETLRQGGKPKESLEALRTAAELDPRKYGPIWDKIQQQLKRPNK